MTISPCRKVRGLTPYLLEKPRTERVTTRTISLSRKVHRRRKLHRQSRLQALQLGAVEEPLHQYHSTISLLYSRLRSHPFKVEWEWRTRHSRLHSIRYISSSNISLTFLRAVHRIRILHTNGPCVRQGIRGRTPYKILCLTSLRRRIRATGSPGLGKPTCLQSQ